MDADREDVRRVLAGDAEAFAGIVHRWQEPLLNLAFRLCRDRALAEDLVQEAFVKAFRGLRHWRGEGRFSTWLFSVALNHVRSHLRRHRPTLVGLEFAADTASDGPSEPDLDAAREAIRVRLAVAALPERYREALTLFHLNDLGVAEVAQVLGVPEGTVKARLHRGRHLLRERLGRERPARREGA